MSIWTCRQQRQGKNVVFTTTGYCSTRFLLIDLWHIIRGHHSSFCTFSRSFRQAKSTANRDYLLVAWLPLTAPTKSVDPAHGAPFPHWKTVYFVLQWLEQMGVGRVWNSDWVVVVTTPIPKSLRNVRILHYCYYSLLCLHFKKRIGTCFSPTFVRQNNSFWRTLVGRVGLMFEKLLTSRVPYSCRRMDFWLHADTTTDAHPRLFFLWTMDLRTAFSAKTYGPTNDANLSIKTMGNCSFTADGFYCE